MVLASKTVEICANISTILHIVTDFEAYPQWNPEITQIHILHHYNDGRPSQLSLQATYGGMSGTFIQAIYYPTPTQIRTILQQGDFFTKQEYLFSAIELNPTTTLLTVDLDIELINTVPKLVIKKAINDTLNYLADNLKKRAEQYS